MSLRVQAARAEQAAGNLRAVSAAFRLEFMVCVAEFVAPGADHRAHGAEPASRRCRCADAFCGESVSEGPAAAGACCGPPILVLNAPPKTLARHFVPPSTPRPPS